MVLMKNDSQVTILLNKDGYLYPVAMTEEQKKMIDLFIATISQEKSFRILDKAPVVKISEVIKKIENSYGIKVIY